MSSVGLGSQSPIRFSFIRECFMEITLPPPTRASALYIPETDHPGQTRRLWICMVTLFRANPSRPWYRLVNKLDPVFFIEHSRFHFGLRYAFLHPHHSSISLLLLADRFPYESYSTPDLGSWIPLIRLAHNHDRKSLDDRPEWRDQLFPGGNRVSPEIFYPPDPLHFNFPVSVPRYTGCP